MVLTEAKLRSVVREELYQYLIEEGFFDKIKSGFQRLTGRGQTTQQKQQPERLAGFERFTPTREQIAQFEQDEKLARSRDKQSQKTFIGQVASITPKKVEKGTYIPIQSDSDIQKALKIYSTKNPIEALKSIFDHLQINLNLAIEKDEPISENEKQMYKIFILDVQKEVGQSDLVLENEGKKALDQQELNKLRQSLAIPKTLLGKTIMAFSDFIFKNYTQKEVEDLKKQSGEDIPMLNSDKSLRELFSDSGVSQSFTFLKDSYTKIANKNVKPEKETKPTRQYTASQKFFKPGENIEERKTFKRRK